MDEIKQNQQGTEPAPVLSQKDLQDLEKTKNSLLDSVKNIVPMDLLKKENLTDEDKEAMKGHIASYLEKTYLERYHLEKCDLNAEYEKIKVKRSGLSRSQRDAVVGYFLIFKFGPVVQKKLDELQNKTDRTPEEDELLKAIVGSDKLEDAHQIVKKYDDAHKDDAPAEELDEKDSQCAEEHDTKETAE